MQHKQVQTIQNFYIQMNTQISRLSTAVFTCTIVCDKIENKYLSMKIDLLYDKFCIARNKTAVTLF